VADPTVLVAVISGAFAFAVACVGVVKSIYDARRRMPEPTADPEQGGPEVLTAALRSMARDLEEAEARAAAAERRALQCEAREAAREGRNRR
jgi:hypothetical protein